MKKVYLLSASLLLFGQELFSQTAYLTLHSEEYQLLDRLETFSGELASFSTSLKPTSRKDAIRFFQEKNHASYIGNLSLSKIDKYNLDRAISISGEWTETSNGMNGAVVSDKPILRYFYQRQADMIHVHTDDFFLAVNPVIYSELIKERDVEKLGYMNTRGLELRGRIKDRIGFYTLMADHQERPLGYVREWEKKHNAFPRYDYYRNTKNGNSDLFLARGYVDVNLIDGHSNLTFGYDKNFLGDGMRSLFISDAGAPATFLRLRTNYGRFTYENLFLELIADYKRGDDQVLPHKYATMNYLSFRAARWLDIGIFESTMFGSRHLSTTNIIPVIFYQTLARSLGAEQKTSLGVNFKAIALNTVQVYGQGFFDAIDFRQLGKGWWGNQFGGQLGVKYFDAFTLSGLDLQAEANMVRPFTYSSADDTRNHTHYNQALAHPFGADFYELLARMKYQPIPKLYLDLKGSYSNRGLDLHPLSNNGNDIFKNSNLRTNDYGFDFRSFDAASLYMNFNVAYEIRPRLFLEAGVYHLERSRKDGSRIEPSSSIYGGIRWNMSRKEYDVY